jgi:hypothetical protein
MTTVTPGPPKSHRFAPAAIGTVLLGAGTVLPLFRQTGTRSWQTIWAEDGQIYFQQAKEHGLDVLFRSYAGYEQLPPRVIGVFSPLVPLRELPVYLAVMAVLVAALLALFLYHYSADWITSRYLRVALASLLVLMPVMGDENTANITNTIWLFAAVAPWALISLRESRRDIMLRSAVVFLAATATTLSLIFVPLAIGYALIRKTRATWAVASSFLAGCVIQGWVILHAHYHNPDAGHPSVTQLGRATAVRVFALFFTGDRTQEPRLSVPTHLYLIAILCLVVLGVLYVGASRRAQALGIVLIAYAVISFAAPVWYRNAIFLLGPLYIPGRYSVVPVLILASAGAVLVASPDRRDRALARFGRPVLAVQILVVIVSSFSVSNIRSVAPTWSAAVAQTYRAGCVGASPSKLVKVPTQKTVEGKGSSPWLVTLPCHDIGT